MTAPGSDEALLESLDRHFIAGCLSLSDIQMIEHKARGVCSECESHAQTAQAANPVEIADDLFESAHGWRPGGTR